MYIVLDQYGYIIDVATNEQEAQERLKAACNLSPLARWDMAEGSYEQVTDNYDVVKHNRAIAARFMV